MPVVKHRDHNEILGELQDQYLVDRDPDVLLKMYGVFVCMSKNMIRDYFGSRKLHIIPEEMNEKSHDIAAMMIERYLKDKTFRIQKSFSGYLRNGPWKRIMYQNVHHDRTASLDEINNERRRKDEEDGS